MSILSKLFHIDEIADLNRQIDINQKRVEQLEEQLKEYEGIELKNRVLTMLVNDDPAICELLDAAEKIEKNKRNNVYPIREQHPYNANTNFDRQLAYSRLSQGQIYGSLSQQAGAAGLVGIWHI